MTESGLSVLEPMTFRGGDAPRYHLILAADTLAIDQTRFCPNAHVGTWHRPCAILWSGSVFPLNGGSMSAQIIQLSNHRKVRTPAMPRSMDATLTVFVAYLAIGIAINEAMIEAAQVGFTR